MISITIMHIPLGLVLGKTREARVLKMTQNHDWIENFVALAKAYEGRKKEMTT